MLKTIKTFVYASAFVPVLLGAGPSALRADHLACPHPGGETPIASAFGSAGFMQNIAQHPDSIRAVAGKLLEQALNGDGGTTGGCETDCAPADRPAVVYRVSPTAFLAEEKQRDVCLRFETETRDNPLRFEPRAFDTVDELNEWIMDFSQGRGEDGKLLYARCSANCSPRYTFLIAEQRAGFEVTAEVQCGLARDKSNDQYRISTALRRSCAVN